MIGGSTRVKYPVLTLVELYRCWSTAINKLFLVFFFCFVNLWVLRFLVGSGMSFN